MARTKKKTKKSTPRRSTRVKKKPITPEDLMAFKFISAPQISPDGRRVVMVHKILGGKNEAISNLYMANADGSPSPSQFTSGGKDRHPRWSSDGSTIAFIGGREKHAPQIYTIGANGGEATALTSFPEGTLMAFQWSPDGKSIAVSFREQEDSWTQAAIKARKELGLHDPPRVIDDWWYRFDGDGYFNAQRFHLYLVDVATGSHKKIYDKDTLGFFEFDFSPDSRQIVLNVNHDRKALIKPEQTQLVRLNLSTGKATIIPNLPEGPKASPKWSPDGKRIAYAGRAGEGDIYSVENLELWVCDPIKGKPKSITAKSDYCLLAVSLSDTADVAFGPTFQWRPDSRRILVKLGWHGQVHIASIKPSGGPIDFLTKGRIDYDMGNISADSKHIALTSSTTTSLSETMVGTLSNDSIETWQITNFNGPLFKQRTLSRPSTAWVKTNENSKVHVWTMLPPNFSPRKKYPAVLQIHGGPHAQYGEGFFHEFQTLASAGYIVFFSNPRGSKGYGRDHTAHLKWKWGINDWPDFQAVIEHMKNHPNVDTKRMGVMGGSYGGFSTNWIISHCRDFAGAITDRCVSNLVSLGGNSDWIEKPDGYFPGNFWDRPEQRWDCSPIKYFKNVKTPTLIIHSEGDLRCNIEQADQVFTALKLLNVPTRLVRYPQTTSHGMSRGGPPDMRIHRLHQILDWWNRYLQ